MKLGLVGFQGGGKSALFQLLTGQAPDPSKVQLGQLGEMVVPDERFDRLVAMFKPKKIVPTKIPLYDTPGLGIGETKANAQRLGIMRESSAMVLVVGVYSGKDPAEEVQAFLEECLASDLQIASNRLDRLKKDMGKPRADKEALQLEQDALAPMEAAMTAGQSLRMMSLNAEQQRVARTFAFLSAKPLLILLNTAETKFDQKMVAQMESLGYQAVAAPVGLESEIADLSPEDRAVFAEEMGLTESCKTRIARALFEVTQQITFYTCDEKEVHSWLLDRGGTSLDAAGTIHTDLAKGFIRAEIIAVEDLLRLGSEKEVKGAGLFRLEGKEYVMQDGDEIVVRANV